MQNENKPKMFGVWWLAMRPFSFPASAAPVVLGTTLATTIGGVCFKPLHFLLALIGMLMLHGGANILNDAYDYRKGLDRDVLPVSGAVVRGLVTPETALKGASLLFVLGSLIGVYLAAVIGWPILIIGVLGVALGIFYSAAPLAFKYQTLGDAAVLIDFGLLGALGAWIVQTGSFSWLPMIWGLPVAFLIVGILHANNWRDIASDTRANCSTVASFLGDKNSERYYAALLFLPYVLVLFFVAATHLTVARPKMPIWCLATFMSLPLAYKLMQKAAHREKPKNPFDFLALDGATAQLSLMFGFLYVAAFLIDYWLR